MLNIARLEPRPRDRPSAQKKYTGEGGDEGRKKKKKKAKAAKSTGSQALVIKDEDISGCKPAELQQVRRGSGGAC